MIPTVDLRAWTLIAGSAALTWRTRHLLLAAKITQGQAMLGYRVHAR